MLEKTVETYLVDRVRAAGGDAYKFTSPARVSVPDRIVVFPPARIYFVELKRPGGKLTRGQEREHARLCALGCDVRVIDSREAVDAFVREVGSVNAAGRPDFEAVRDKRMSELTPAQCEDAHELWLREQIGWFNPDVQRHLQLLLDRLDVARASAAAAPIAICNADTKRDPELRALVNAPIVAAAAERAGMQDAFERSEFYFNGESPAERASNWKIWVAAWKAARRPVRTFVKDIIAGVAAQYRDQGMNKIAGEILSLIDVERAAAPTPTPAPAPADERAAAAPCRCSGLGPCEQRTDGSCRKERTPTPADHRAASWHCEDPVQKCSAQCCECATNEACKMKTDGSCGRAD
ncbi:hypothetical protein [Burkholderia cenocepacia]|uniref:hypothetical protein n=1 Tax=Burkholderia cenocepacia TaxID=95486 RepID=UPI000D0C4C24|nr:hypothetical protein [Burkholderia cenocepacia]SOT39819.1 VRR-NUC domain protein (modular protein) [Burkholderia cenocepacia]